MEQGKELVILLLLLCHGGPGPDLLAPWIYKYIACRMKEVLKDLTDFMN